MNRRMYLGAVSGIAIAVSGCLDGVEVGSDSDDDSSQNREPTTDDSSSQRGLTTDGSNGESDAENNQDNQENDPDASISVLNLEPVGYSVSVSVELGDASAMSIDYNGEEIKAVNEDGSYDISGYEDDAIMEVEDVDLGDSFTVYAIYGDSYVEIESTVAA